MATNGQMKRRATAKLRGDRKQRTLTVEILPTDGDARVRLTDFLTKLNAFRDAVSQTERLLYGEESGVELRIVALGQHSPPFVTLEAVGIGRSEGREAALLSAVLTNLDALDRGDESVRAELDLSALNAYRSLAPSKGQQIAELRISDGGAIRTIDRGFAQRVTEVVGPDELGEGSVTGALEMINLHNAPRFAIFQTIRDRKVTCNFPQDLKTSVIAALEKYVRVTGTLHFKKWDPRPHEVDVKSIEVFPPETELPQITDLAGINPDIIGDMASEDFLAAARNANW